MASTSLDLSQIKTDALSAASTFRTLIGLGTLATQNGTISDYLTIATAASTYLSLTGGTLTGGLSGTTVTTSGLIKGGRFNTGIYEDNTAGFSTYQTSGHFFAGSHTTFAGSAIWSFRAGPGYVILNDASNGSQIRSSGQNALGGVFSIIGSTSTSPSNADHYMGFRFDGAFLSLPLMLGRLGTTAVASVNEGAWLLGEASDTLGIRRSTNAQRFNLYGTYTDASNYRRLYLSSTTAGAFTIGVEGAGTGASGNGLNINSILTLTDPSLVNSCVITSTNTSTNRQDAPVRIFRNNALSDSTWQPMIYLINGGLANGGGSNPTQGPAIWMRGGPTSQSRVRIDANGHGMEMGIDGITLYNYDSYYSFSASQHIWNLNFYGSPGQVALRLNTSYLGLYATPLAFGSSVGSSTVDLYLYRDTANTLGQRNSTNSQTFRIYNTYTDASNYIRQSLSFTTYSSTVHAQLAAEGAGTGAVNVPFVITPRGTGAFILGPMPDGTATGGNARGAYAVDLQSNLRSAATQVASGLYAVAIGSRNVSSGENTIAIGLDNTSTQYDSVAIGKVNTAGWGGVSIGWSNSAITTGIAIGQGNSCNGNTAVGIGSNNSASDLYANAIGRANTASATRSTAIGTNALSNRFGMYSYADGAFAANGDAQMAMFVLRNKTTDNTPTTLFLDGASARLTIPSGKLFLFTAKIVGVRSDGLRRASYVRKGTIINVAGATSIVGAIEAVGTDVEDDPNLNITITADDTNDALDIQVTGITGETWRWVAVVEGVEVAYGT